MGFQRLGFRQKQKLGATLVALNLMDYLQR